MRADPNHGAADCVVERDDIHVKGLSDKKNYRRIVLANGLEALLINEPVEEDTGEYEEANVDADVDEVGNSEEDDDDSDESTWRGPQRSAAAMVVGVGLVSSVFTAVS